MEIGPLCGMDVARSKTLGGFKGRRGLPSSLEAESVRELCPLEAYC